jgi:hypothetical protein
MTLVERVIEWQASENYMTLSPLMESVAGRHG